MGLFRRKRKLAPKTQTLEPEGELIKRPTKHPSRKKDDLIGKVIGEKHVPPKSSSQTMTATANNNGKWEPTEKEQQEYLDRLFQLSQKHLSSTPNEYKQSILTGGEVSVDTPPGPIQIGGRGAPRAQMQRNVHRNLGNNKVDKNRYLNSSQDDTIMNFVKSFDLSGFLSSLSNIDYCLAESLCSATQKTSPLTNPEFDIPNFPHLPKNRNIPRVISVNHLRCGTCYDDHDDNFDQVVEANQKCSNCKSLHHRRQQQQQLQQQQQQQQQQQGPTRNRENNTDEDDDDVTTQDGNDAPLPFLAQPIFNNITDTISLTSTIPTRDSHNLP